MSEKDNVDIQVIARCAQILRQIEPGSRLRVTSLAKELGIGRSTLHRYLTSMVNADLIENVGDGTYTPGPLLAQLGTMALNSLQVVEASREPMQKLCQDVSQTVVLSVWGGLAPVVTRVEIPEDRLIQVLVRIGSALPINAAQTRVFLSFLGSRTTEKILALVPERREELDADIRHASEKGYLVYSGSIVGLSTIAVPVFNARGIAATLAIIGTDAYVLGPDNATLLSRLRAAAQDLSLRLGFDGSYPGAPTSPRRT